MKKQTLEKLIKSETTIQSKYYHDVLHTFLAGMVAAGVLLTISSNTPVHAAANDTNDVKTSLTMSSSNSSSSNQVTSSSVSSSSESANSATDEEDTNKSTDSTASSNASKAESVSDSKTSQDAQQTSANSQSSSQVSSSSSSAVSSSETVTNNSSSNENNVVAENSSSVASTALSTKDQNNSAVTNKKVLAAADTQVDSWEIGDASRPRVDAVDVSSYQDGMTQANFNELKAKGVKTVIVKVTEGNNYTNPYASQEINYAQNAGLNIMVYHYATFNSTDSAKQEANYLLQELNTLSLAKTTRIFADMEDVGTSSDDVKDNLLNFFNVLNAAGYTDHAAYAYLNYQYLAQVIAAVGKQNIWLAQYPYTPSASNLKNTDYGAWQDSSQTELSGYDGYLDSSIDYNGLVVYQTANNGFIHQDANVYYYENNTKVTGQKKINNYWYYFDDATGAMVTGFKTIINQNKTVYYNSNGQMQYGKQQINGHWYLFDSILGSMKTGFQYIANQNKTVYYNNNGQMQYGQQQINGHWYLFDNTTGTMKTGFQYIANQNKTVYYNNNGQMQYGQQKINGHWYLFDNTTGAMKTGFQIINNQNKIVYYANNGQIQYGNQVINGQHYNFDNITGALANQSSISLKLYNAHFAAKTSQVVVTVANYRTSASVYLYSKDKNGIWVQNWQTNGYVGGSGVGEAHEGSSRTPIGAYSLGFAFGTHSGVMSSLGYRKIDSKSYWIEDVNDSQYNTWQERSWSKSPSEHLIDYQVQYEYAIVINYNMNPIVKGKGSGFFIHVANGHATAGCVSIPRGQVISLIETLKSGAYIVNVNNINQISNY